VTELPESDAPLPSSAPASDAGLLPEPSAAAPASSSLRLLFIPLVLVVATVLIWAILRWPARETVSPRDLVRALAQPGRSHWQQAYALAELLRDPQHAELRQDAALAADLAALLQVQLDAAELDANRIHLRVFLCRALGEFAIPAGLPVLVQAARQERGPAEVAVRRAALEALAARASHIGADTLRNNRAVLDVFATAARDHGQGPSDQAQRAELRAGAAFGLGVLGGQPALEALRPLLDDPSPNVRYNAATGLARHGQTAAIPVLLEMLAPENPEATAGEVSAAGRDWKQVLVWTNAVRAATQLAQRNPGADRRPLAAAIELLTQADVPAGVRSQAREALTAIRRIPNR